MRGGGATAPKANPLYPPLWNEHIDPFLEKNTETFKNAEIDYSVTVESTSASVTDPGKKRKPISTPGSLLPASKVARTEQLSQIECTKEEEIDLKLQRHFLGILSLQSIML